MYAIRSYYVSPQHVPDVQAQPVTLRVGLEVALLRRRAGKDPALKSGLEQQGRNPHPRSDLDPRHDPRLQVQIGRRGLAPRREVELLEITSYSIHYTKLYEIVGFQVRAGLSPVDSGFNSLRKHVFALVEGKRAGIRNNFV